MTTSFRPRHPLYVTIDVEDWPQSSWDRSLPITERAARNTRHVLELLSKLNALTTMFVLGRFAESFPEVVREICDAGHEVASHGYGHVEVFHQSPDVFREDIRRGKKMLEDIVGCEVRGYRAPDFSIVRRSIWALDVLADEGFQYDSSIFPIRAPRYGIPDWPQGTVEICLPSGRRIIEVPIASYRWFGRNWPVGGGGYHRLLPGVVSRWLASRILSSRGFVFYCHPYEFDPLEFSEISLSIPLMARLHQGLGRRQFERRFAALVTKFGSQPIRTLIAERNWPSTPLRIVDDSPTGVSMHRG